MSSYKQVDLSSYKQVWMCCIIDCADLSVTCPAPFSLLCTRVASSFSLVIVTSKAPVRPPLFDTSTESPKAAKIAFASWIALGRYPHWVQYSMWTLQFSMKRLNQLWCGVVLFFWDTIYTWIDLEQFLQVESGLRYDHPVMFRYAREC